MAKTTEPVDTEAVKDIFADHFKIAASTITDDTKLFVDLSHEPDDRTADILDIVEVVMDLEEELEIMLPDRTILDDEENVTFGQFVSALQPMSQPQ